MSDSKPPYEYDVLTNVVRFRGKVVLDYQLADGTVIRGEADGELLNAQYDYKLDRDHEKLRVFLFGWRKDRILTQVEWAIIADLSSGNSFLDKRKLRKAEESIWATIETWRVSDENLGLEFSETGAFKRLARQQLGEGATRAQLQSKVNRIRKTYKDERKKRALEDQAYRVAHERLGAGANKASIESEYEKIYRALSKEIEKERSK